MERVLRVCIFGPESTGKTTLCQRLAQHFQTSWVPEYARTYLESRQQPFALGDVEPIARGQLQWEAEQMERAQRVLFCDTDLLTTTIWSHWFFAECPSWVSEQARLQHFDLTLLMEVDVPWVADSVRYLPKEGAQFLERCLAELENQERSYRRVGGDWETRFQTSVEAVKELLDH